MAIMMGLGEAKSNSLCATVEVARTGRLVNHRKKFQEFDQVKAYYDGAWHAISNALHSTIAAKTTKQAVTYREAHSSIRHLFKLADYANAMDFAVIK